MMDDKMEKIQGGKAVSKDAENTCNDTHKTQPSRDNKVYANGHGVDSTSGLGDAVEAFLSHCISEARAELEETRRPEGRDKTWFDDGALITFLASYLAAHPEPQRFFEALRHARFGAAVISSSEELRHG
ncbi:MAG: hypothetical protein OIF40_16500 [Mangrovicoccus sp.]|nr:hypothetical protein [Mangrovicoccus sp.]